MRRHPSEELPVETDDGGHFNSAPNYHLDLLIPVAFPDSRSLSSIGRQVEASSRLGPEAEAFLEYLQFHYLTFSA